MRDNRHIPCNPLITALIVALLFLGACAQKMETPATDSKTAVQSSASPPPAAVEPNPAVQIGQADASRALQSSPASPRAKEFAERLHSLQASRSGPAGLSHYHPYPSPPYYPRPQIIPPGADRFPDKTDERS